LGVHISRVRSLFLDNWKREELELMRDSGNLKSRTIWEVSLPKYFVRPSANDAVCFKEQYIKAKYERKEYVADAKHEAKEGVPVKEGWLTKKGNVVKNWKRRWFIMRGTVLSYYKKQKDSFSAGEIMLKDSSHTECLADPLEGKTFCFSINTPTREFFISADSAKDMFDWVLLIRGTVAAFNATNNAGKMASDIDIKEIVPKISTGVDIQKRKMNKKTYTNCFIGAEAVDWMLLHLELKNRSEGTILGQKLLHEGFIQSCTSEFFTDSNSLYQFLKTQ